MGMPIFTLPTVASIDAKVDAVLRKFRFFAFVIHDPKEHKDFDNELNEVFERLDFWSRENLLFFALVRPAGSVSNRALQGDCQEESHIISTITTPQVAKDIEIPSYAFAQTLQIPTEDLPCIVVTRNLRSDSFEWVKTSKATLVQQILELAFIAAKYPQRNPLEEKRFNALQHSNRISLDTSLYDAIHKVLSFIIASDNTEADHRIKEMARNEAKNTIRKNKSYFEYKKKNPDTNDETVTTHKLENIAQKQLSLLALLINTNEINEGLTWFDDVKLFFEDESRLMIKTSEVIFLVANNTSLQENLGASLDYSPAVLCMAKSFENEVNRSIVHWLRLKLNIKPAYYNKYQEGVTNCSYTIDKTTILFNKTNGRYWVPPSLSESQKCCYRNVFNIRNECFRNIPDNDWSRIMETWSRITKLRNKAAHQDPSGSETAVEMKRHIQTLAQLNFFTYIHEMKQSFKMNNIKSTLS